ncbi:MAG: M48 family metalloprotease [Acidobacteriales bacterium]|nr:M48 family metalloprotease [Terriglobales bacterium]
MTSRSRSARFLALLLAFSLLVTPLLEARYKPKPGFNLFSQDQEIQVGQEEATKIPQQMPLVTDPQINAYVEKLGMKLAAQAPGYKYPYSFKVVNQKEINAFALPGGPIFINLGTIQAADQESQLAGVIGHEIGHVVMRHSTNQATKAQLFGGLASILAGKVGGGGGITGALAQAGISFGLNSTFLKFSRDAEKQADLVGAGLIHDAGYNPAGMPAFFHKLEAESGASGSEFFLSHPNPGNRANLVAKEVATFPPKSYMKDSAEFLAVKKKAATIKTYTAKEIGSGSWKSTAGAPGTGTADAVIERNPAMVPSGKFTTFQHDAYSIQYPDNWTANGNARSNGVTILPQGGSSGGPIAYGVIVSGYKMQDRSLTQSADQVAAAFIKDKPSMKQQGQGQDFRLQGMNARSLVFLSESPLKGETERDWLVGVERTDGVMLYFLFIAPDKDFKQFQPAFESMLKSLQMKYAN